jgi:hypothetical protein
MRVPQTLGAIGKRLTSLPSPLSILRSGPFGRRVI